MPFAHQANISKTLSTAFLKHTFSKNWSKTFRRVNRDVLIRILTYLKLSYVTVCAAEFTVEHKTVGIELKVAIKT